MTTFLYNSGILLYLLAIRIASLFSVKARVFIKGRKNLLKKLEQDFKNNTSNIIWIHCASLGEFEQGRPLMEAFKDSMPGHKILLTFFSPSGYEVRKHFDQADWVYYLPLDQPSKAKKFIEVVQPQIAVFIKYEYWFNVIKAARDHNIPIISVSSIFRKDQIFFKWYGGLFRNMLGFFDHFFVQDYKSKELLEQIGIKKITNAGDTRFDRVLGIRRRILSIPVAKKFSDSEEVMIIGSCWPSDMEILTPFINEKPHLKFILAPHNMDQKFIRKIEHDLTRSTIRFSDASEKNVTDYDVLIIDNIGMLSSLYQYGKYAFIGGAFGHGLHNILEPATFGLPVFFGNKNYSKFREANDLINQGGAFAVGSYADFILKFRNLEHNVATYLMTSDIMADYIKNNTGATDIIISYCKKILSNSKSS